MKKGKYRYHAVDIPLYFGSLHVLIGHDLAATNEAAGFPKKEVRGRGYDDFDALVFEAEKGGHTGYFMLLRPDTTPKIIAHEAVHVVNRIFSARGIQLDIANDEPQAYLMGWVVEQAHHALGSKEIKAKKTIELR